MTTVQIWTVNAPSVACELIDGELIVITLETGNYYNSTGVGSFVWDCISKGISRQQITTALARAYAKQESDISRDLDGYFDALVRESLIKPDTSAAREVTELPAIQPGAYQAPALGVFSDMKDLLLLDPIHDVGDAGWPTQRRETGS
jgi:hypothetical protein